MLNSAAAVAVSPDGKHLYAAAFFSNTVSHFTIDAGGNLTFAGCIGNLSGCTATTPAGALDDALDVTLSPDGKHLYASAFSSNAVSHFTIDAGGNLTFAGCIGNLAGCTATSPAGALGNVEDVTLSPDGKQLYAVALLGNTVSQFTIDAGGNLTFAGCIGNLAGCTATNPAGALDGALDVTLSPDGKQLYAAAFLSDTVSHFTIDAGGNLTFAGCIGNLAGCTATSPAGALDSANGVSVSPDGKQLYVAAALGNVVTHLRIEQTKVPNTRITRAKINSKKHKATFKFKAIGNATGFECALAKKKHKPKFKRCSSPKAYKHLKRGSYTFEVRAVGPSGHDPSPAKRRFRIA